MTTHANWLLDRLEWLIEGRERSLFGNVWNVKAFFAPKTTLGSLDAEAASALIETVADVALIIDAHGVIRDRAFQSEELAAELEGGKDWIGRRWIDTVTIESQAKVTALLNDAADSAPSRQRHINHPSVTGVDVPVLYSTTRLGRTRNVVACGRDLRIVSTLQRRLLDTQQSMERDYTRLRQVETRYRLLFQMSPDPVLIVDALTQKIVEANRAATRMLESRGLRLTSRGVTEIFTAESQLAIQALLAGMRVSPRGEEVRAELAGQGGDVRVSAALFRQEEANFYLVRLAAAEKTPAGDAAHTPQALFARLAAKSADGIVVTDGAGVTQVANPAFLEMAELATVEQARGERLDRWMGRLGIDLDILLGNLRQRGNVRLYATKLRGEFGAEMDVEVSAASLGEGDADGFGFTIRDVGRRPGSERKPVLELPRSVEQLSELIGRVSLKELVRESTDMIERLCIEAALEVTSDNRASAAEMLGLSRQSLYVKLRRYGLGDLDEAKE